MFYKHTGFKLYLFHPFVFFRIFGVSPSRSNSLFFAKIQLLCWIYRSTELEIYIHRAGDICAPNGKYSPIKRERQRGGSSSPYHAMKRAYFEIYSSMNICTPLRMECNPNSSGRTSFNGRKNASAASSIALKCSMSATLHRKNMSSVCTEKPE